MSKMCGIAGLYNLDDEPGPDGQGISVHGPIGLGHRRLAILDLTPAGRQPMETAEGRFAISYNGEVYNFRELRGQLASLGHAFRSQTDTEVVLHAFAEWGPDCLRRFNGMFAFAVWDRERRALFLARDRYGIKPLHYARCRNAFLFASELKGLFAHPNCRPEIDPAALVEYLTFQNLLADRSLFRDVRLLPAGCWMEVTPAGRDAGVTPAPQRYWDFNFQEPERPADDQEYREEVLRLFRQAVRRQLVSDVEVGAYLSGGMDSGSITAVASQQLGRLRTFTCGFDLASAVNGELACDERASARRMSSLFGTVHHEAVIRPPDMERAVPRVAWHLEEPRVGQSYPNYYAAELAARHVKVVLSGTGGDELFGGYPWRYYPCVVGRSFDEFADAYYRQWRRLIPAEREPDVFRPIAREARHVSPRNIFGRVLGEPRGGAAPRPEDLVNRCLEFEARTFLHGLLVVEDKLSMAHGLETRVPFLDNDLVDFAMTIPARLKLGRLGEVARLHGRRHGAEHLDAFADPSADAARWNELIRNPRDGKLVLRQAMSRLLPDDIVTAGKRGFSAPDEAWFRRDSLDYVRQTLDGPETRIHEFLDADAIRRLVNDHAEGRTNRRLLIWSLLSVEHCLRSFCEKETSALAAA